MKERIHSNVTFWDAKFAQIQVYKVYEQKNEIIKNLGQKNEGIMSFWSNFHHLKAVPPGVNWSMTSLVKVYKVDEQKNEIIKNLGQKYEGIKFSPSQSSSS